LLRLKIQRPTKTIGIDKSCPIVKSKKTYPKKESGALVNSMQNRKNPYRIKKSADICPVAFSLDEKIHKIKNNTMPSKKAS
jgi:hypothetical protein